MSTKNTVQLELNKGFIIESKNKSNENAPDFFGKINVEGRIYSLGAWIKNTEKGYFFSINADNDILSDEDKAQQRKDSLKAYKAVKSASDKEAKNTGAETEYIVMNNTGSLHVSKSEDKSDFFGMLKLEGVEVKINGMINETKDKDAIIFLTVSKGKSKEERNNLINGIFGK